MPRGTVRQIAAALVDVKGRLHFKMSLASYFSRHDVSTLKVYGDTELNEIHPGFIRDPRIFSG